jgi:PKD repeat protein
VSASANPTSGIAPLAVTFSSAGTYDPEGASLTYNWAFGDGSNSTAANPTKTYNTAGTYVATLSVSDGVNTTTSGNITVTVSASNQPPIASASVSPASGVAPLTVTFSSSGSSDPEGKPLTYNWDFGDGTTSTSANPTKAYQTAGNYTARLTVSDGVLSTGATPLPISVVAPGSGLVAAYGFEEGNGTMTSDSSGNGNDGTLVGGTTWATGKYGNALSFNGTDAYVSINNSPSLGGTSALTVEAWVYPVSAAANWRPIAFKAFDASQISYVLQGVTPQSVAAFFVSPSSTNLVSSSALAVNVWSHLAGTYDGATMRMYVNGMEVSNRTQSGALNLSSQPLTIGGSALYSAYWQGLIDDVRIYNRAITPSEIQGDMNTPVRPGAPTGLRIK